jgi:molecular chaperone GrpE
MTDEIKKENTPEEQVIKNTEPTADSFTEPVDATAELQIEIDELKDKYLRLYSEFDNYKRRTTKERIDLFKTAGQEVLSSMIPIIDDFDRTLKSFENIEINKAVKEGIQLVHNKMTGTLTQQGLKAFVSVGKDFDPDFHEAITKIPAPNKKARGKVVDEVEKGYMLHDKVIRFAKVVVGE